MSRTETAQPNILSDHVHKKRYRRRVESSTTIQAVLQIKILMWTGTSIARRWRTAILNKYRRSQRAFVNGNEFAGSNRSLMTVRRSGPYIIAPLLAGLYDQRNDPGKKAGDVNQITDGCPELHHADKDMAAFCDKG